MVDISEKMEEVMELVYGGYYFTINRGRQFGKTTTLFAIEERLSDSEYICVCISFEAAPCSMFDDESGFCQGFLWRMNDSLMQASPEIAKLLLNYGAVSFDDLSRLITILCKDKKIVLLIDEVDATSNNHIFLKFLSMLRSKYLVRDKPNQGTFHSVVLAGVHDIKNIKLKLVKEGKAVLRHEERQFNSPWNIAADFEVDLSFSPKEIATMLTAYEKDHRTGMDVDAIAGEIYYYTSGYPFLVSRVCKHIDEKLKKDWTIFGVHEAIKIIASERNMLFDDLVKNIASYKNLSDLLYLILIKGKKPKYVFYDDDIYLAVTFGYVKKESNIAVISNKIFEMVLCEIFIKQKEKEESISPPVGGGLIGEVTSGGVFNMELCLRKFADYYRYVFAEKNISFLEEHGALILLSYLNPIINGNGFIHLESRLVDNRRMDIVVDYGKEQFIIELKLWHGEANRDRAYEQLIGYMEAKNANKGYLVTFDLRKSVNREKKTEWVHVGSRQIFDVVV